MGNVKETQFLPLQKGMPKVENPAQNVFKRHKCSLGLPIHIKLTLYPPIPYWLSPIPYWICRVNPQACTVMVISGEQHAKVPLAHQTQKATMAASKTIEK